MPRVRNACSRKGYSTKYLEALEATVKEGHDADVLVMCCGKPFQNPDTNCVNRRNSVAGGYEDEHHSSVIISLGRENKVEQEEAGPTIIYTTLFA